MDQIDNLLNESQAVNATRAFTPEAGIASTALFLMAIIPIYIGSKKSIKALEESLRPGSDLSVFKQNEAAMFPIYASFFLFGIFIAVKLIAAQYINFVISVYVFTAGLSAVFIVIRPIGKLLCPSFLSKPNYNLVLFESTGDHSETEAQKEAWSFEFDRTDAVPFLFSLGVGLVYFITKHWMANNVIALCFAVKAIELLHLDRILNGCVLLGGLFFYDIFWVFGTNVMVFVATQLEAPIKVVFPRDILANGFFSTNLGMLGLGDIVIPGIFLAILLRFDTKLNRNGSCLYFWTGYVAYIIGLLTTFVVMYVFNHAQPALLYLVPTCLGFPLAMAVIKGDFTELMAYKDVPKEVEERLNESKKAQ